MYCVAQGTMFNIPLKNIMAKNMKKTIYVCVCVYN